MVHTRPDLEGRWASYYRLPTAERRQLARTRNADYNQRIVRNRTRKIHPEQGMRIDEMPNPRMRAIAVFQGWEQFVGEPEPYDPVLVKEFYAAMMPPAFGEWGTVVIRGVRVRITIDDICRHYNVPRHVDLDPTFGIPPVPDVAQDDYYSPVIAANLRRSGRNNWEPKADRIKKAELRQEIGMWLRFVKCRLAPSTHYSDADWYVARVLYCLQNNMHLDVGHIIILHMMDAAAERCKGILPFPSLVTQMCRDAGVRVGNTIPPPPPFDRVAYQKNISAAARFDGQAADEEEDAHIRFDEAVDDVEYDTTSDEGEEPEDPRILERMDRMEARLISRVDRGFYNLSLLVRGQEVPEDAFPVPDEAGPSDPRPTRRSRRNRGE